MKILSHPGNLENSVDQTYEVQADDLERDYKEAGYHRHDRYYKLTYRHQEYTVVCPEFIKPTPKGNPCERIVIIPEFLIPQRPYPVYVYLYAINLYSTDPSISQRAAAEETRKQFGLETFAHTTLGRALKRLVKRVCQETNMSVNAETTPATTSSDNNVATHADPEILPESDIEPDTTEQNSGPIRSFPCKPTTLPWRELALKILKDLPKPDTLGQFIIASQQLAGNWFRKYCRLLL